MTLQKQLVRTVIAWGALLGFMMLFQPTKLPVVVLIVPFVLLFAAIYSLWNLINLLRTRFFTKQTWQPSRRLSLTVSLSAVLLLVLQSLGQLTLRDVLTVVAIVVLGYAYVARNLSRVTKR